LKIKRSAADALSALAREHPLLVPVRSRWATNLFNLSGLQADLGRYAEAEQSARATIEVSEALAREVPSSFTYRMKVGRGYEALGKVLLKVESHGEGLAMLRKAVEILETSDMSEDLYNLACILALASTVRDPAAGAAAAERQRQDAARAVATIRRAITMGLSDTNVWKNDPDFDSLRARDDFKLLMMDLVMPAAPFAAAR
jgi:tetratricopeptide (TPR) repeat protein